MQETMSFSGYTAHFDVFASKEKIYRRHARGPADKGLLNGVS